MAVTRGRCQSCASSSRSRTGSAVADPACCCLGLAAQQLFERLPSLQSATVVRLRCCRRSRRQREAVVQAGRDIDLTLLQPCYKL